ncbi:LOW QUALITY PROTEIN: hypothetical protein J0S82_020001 [Galemys pyrenaicus]|uniref:Uncharacterized protein n=1 Tax=Galemys pyrenaicus TaxID=202257 RepID=A0A8J6DHB9_GALPY|nr:LOW QUALITY PROTEIN: hypothetical protein J0S82_020001 [Galemys pyrenaicus]
MKQPPRKTTGVALVPCTAGWTRECLTPRARQRSMSPRETVEGFAAKLDR